MRNLTRTEIHNTSGGAISVQPPVVDVPVTGVIDGAMPTVDGSHIGLITRPDAITDGNGPMPLAARIISIR